ncbi:MAG: hypothetical protein JWO38_5886 [Gemmataceae bacterium]|nr:hypothetical protein [Gemmataceae bacterium]
MRELRRLAWAAVVAAATAGPGAAQVSSSPGGGVGVTTGSAATSGGFGTGLGGAGAGGAGGGGNNGLGGAGNGLSGSSLQGTSLPTMQSAPNLALSSTTTTTSLSPSNGLGRWYANPYFLGIYSNSINTNAQPGGFGVTLYQTGGGLGGGQIGFSGTSTGFGRGGGAGIPSGVTATVTDVGGVMIPLPRQIAYAARVRFAVEPAAPAQILTDLRGVIARAPMLANPAGVQVQMDGTAVVLRGSVRDEDEARLVEGLVRLTPGVGVIRNELAFPRP